MVFQKLFFLVKTQFDAAHLLGLPFTKCWSCWVGNSATESKLSSADFGNVGNKSGMWSADRPSTESTTLFGLSFLPCKLFFLLDRWGVAWKQEFYFKSSSSVFGNLVWRPHKFQNPTYQIQIFQFLACQKHFKQINLKKKKKNCFRIFNEIFGNRKSNMLTIGDWSEIWLTVSAKEQLSLWSSLELTLEPLLKTSGVEDLFLMVSPT